MGWTTRQDNRRPHRSLPQRSPRVRARRILLGVVTSAFMSVSVAASAGPAHPERVRDAVARRPSASSTVSSPAPTSLPIGVPTGVPVAGPPVQTTAAITTEPAASASASAPASASAGAPEQEATVTIPRLGLSLPVRMGGQDVINQGFVTHFSGPVSRPPVSVGDAGTYWLAGHHSTHGKPFARLPETAVGDQVVVQSRSGVTFTYTITSTLVVGTKAERSTIYGTNPSAHRILLQTCLSSTTRLLVQGTLTNVS